VPTGTCIRVSRSDTSEGGRINNIGSIKPDSLHGRRFTHQELVSALPQWLEKGRLVRLLLLIDAEPDEKLQQLIDSLSRALPSGSVLTAVYSSLDYMDKVQKSLPPGAEIKYAEDYLNAEELAGIDKQACGWIRNWYRLDCLSEDKSSLYYRDIPLGNLVEYDLYFVLPQLLKKVKAARTILSREQPSMALVLTADADFYKATQLAGESSHCPVIGVKTGREGAQHYEYPIIKAISRLIGLTFDAIIFLWDQAAFKLRRKERGKKLLLFEDYERLYHISDAIRARGKKRVILVGNEGGTLNRLAALRRKRLYRALLYHLNPASVNRVKKARQRVKKAWYGIKDNAAFHNFFDYEGLNLWPLMEEKFADICQSLLPKAIGLIESASRGLAFYRPSLVILNTDVLSHGRAICLIARQMGIPTLMIQHGVYVGYVSGYDVITADKVAAWGKTQVDSYVALGNDSSKVEVVGGYLFDGLYRRSKREGREQEARERVYRQLELDPRQGILTYATLDTPPREKRLSAGQTDDDIEVIFRPIVEAMKEFPEKQLVVKLHPMESEYCYRRVLQEMDWTRERIRVIKRINLHDLIDASEVTITVPSTVALEAIILGKPVVIVNLKKDEDNPYYQRYPTAALYRRYPALYVWKRKDVVPAIKKALGDDEVRQRLAEQRARFLSEDGEYLVDGKSIERIIRLIDRMSG
jgi:hypothetical protein